MLRFVWLVTVLLLAGCSEPLPPAQPGDSAVYPDDDLALSEDANANWVVAHKDGRPY